MVATRAYPTNALARSLPVCPDSVALGAGYLEEHVGVARLIEAAPAGQIVAAELGPDGGDGVRERALDESGSVQRDGHLRGSYLVNVDSGHASAHGRQATIPSGPA